MCIQPYVKFINLTRLKRFASPINSIFHQYHSLNTLPSLYLKKFNQLLNNLQ